MMWLYMNWNIDMSHHFLLNFFELQLQQNLLSIQYFYLFLIKITCDVTGSYKMWCDKWRCDIISFDNLEEKMSKTLEYNRT